MTTGSARRTSGIWVLSALAVVGASGLAAFLTDERGDYGNPQCDDADCDDPQRSLDAVLDGRFGDFFHHQPIMGLFSLLVRLPAVAIARSAGGDVLDEYRAGAFVCLSLAGLLGVLLARTAWRDGADLPAVAAFLGVFVIGCVGTQAVRHGHPEEPLAAALSLAAIVLAARGRTLGAGLLLGAAIGTKEWALLAGGPVLIAAAPQWRPAAVSALVASAALTMPFAAGDLERFREAHAARTRINHASTPANIWWQFGEPSRFAGAGGDVAYPKPIVARLARPGVLALAVVLAALYAHRHRRRRPLLAAETIAFLALLYVLRAVLDTETFGYHLTPMVLAIPVWEVLARRRVPVIGTAAVVAFLATFHLLDDQIPPDSFNAIYLAWTLPLGGYLAVQSYRRSAR